MIGPIERILFICTGNICRSPFAEGLFNRQVREKGLAGIKADSAGLVALPGNTATAMAQRVAAEYQVDLSSHRAKSVSEALLSWCDLALVMEKSQQDAVLSAFPEATGKVLLLRHFARHGSRNRGIADPYGLQYEAYRFCFLDIRETVISLIGCLSGHSRSFERVKVGCYEGYRACESPRFFQWKERTYLIERIVDRWYEGNPEATGGMADYFKVQTDDGSMYLLRYDRCSDNWAVMIR
jgi:protein-tyrosine phosphatase